MPQLIQTFTRNRVEPLHRAQDAGEISIKMANSGTFGAGQIVEETATRGTFRVVTVAGTTPCLIIPYDVATDANGNHWLAAGVAGIEEAQLSVPAYKNGEFDTRDLKGIAGAALADDADNAAILARLGATLISGTIANGIIIIR